MKFMRVYEQQQNKKKASAKTQYALVDLEGLE